MERIMTCIICPRGCEMTVSYEDGRFIDVRGNACKRGAKYAEDECTHPMRSVTSTVMCESGYPVAVKTSQAIPKELIFECMKEINSVTAPDSVSVGDVIIENVLGTGADIIATSMPFKE